MNQLPERHVPVPRHMPPTSTTPAGRPVVAFLERMVERLVAFLDKVIDRAMPVLLGVLLLVAFGVLVAAFAGVFEDRGPGCVTEYSTSGQAACVKR